MQPNLNAMDGTLNQLPNNPWLYISSIKATADYNALTAAGITHIISLFEIDVLANEKDLRQYRRLHLPLADVPNENILKRFATTNEFLDSAFSEGGKVLVHCWLGRSRSSAVLCAYLMYRNKISLRKALEEMRMARPICKPNPGFIRQLVVYERMLTAESEAESSRISSDWEVKKVEASEQHGPKVAPGLEPGRELDSMPLFLTDDVSLPIDENPFLAGPLKDSFT